MRATTLISALLIALCYFTAQAAKNPELPPEEMVVSELANVDSLVAVIDRGALDAIEGVWKFGGDGAVVAIVRRPPTVRLSVDYVIVSIGGANRSLRPGTIVGTANRGGERGSYSASFYGSHSSRHKLKGKKSFTLVLDNDGAYLRFVPRHGLLRFYLPSLLPGIAGRLVHPGYIDRPADGCHRLYPGPEMPVEPRYL